MFVIGIWRGLRLGQNTALVRGKPGIANEVGILLFKWTLNRVCQRRGGEDGTLFAAEIERIDDVLGILGAVNEVGIVPMTLDPDEGIIQTVSKLR